MCLWGLGERYTGFLRSTQLDPECLIIPGVVGTCDQVLSARSGREGLGGCLHLTCCLELSALGSISPCHRLSCHAPEGSMADLTLFPHGNWGWTSEGIQLPYFSEAAALGGCGNGSPRPRCMFPTDLMGPHPLKLTFGSPHSLSPSHKHSLSVFSILPAQDQKTSRCFFYFPHVLPSFLLTPSLIGDRSLSLLYTVGEFYKPISPC